jgi:membrane protease YdiL (CAAX protease family)
LAKLFISPDEPRLRAGWRLLGHFFLLFVSLIIVSIPFALLGNFVPGLDILVNEYSALVVSVTISIYWARRILDKRSFRSLGLIWNSQAGKDVAIGIAVAATMMGLIFVTEWGVGWLEFEGFAWESFTASQISIKLGRWAIIFLLVGWYEELFSRGYVLQNLADGLNMPAAIFLSSVLFSAAHLSNPGTSIASLFGILAAGYFLAYGYVRTRQLWLPIGLHVGWNFFEGPVFGFPVSGIPTYPLLIHAQTGPELITGGAFGPEAGLIVLPALVLGSILIYQYTSKRDTSVY